MASGNNWESDLLDGSFLGGDVGSLFGDSDWKNPANAANPYLSHISGMLQRYFNPYLQEGQNAMAHLPDLEGQYDQMLSNPGALVNKIGSNFHASPGFKFQTNQAMNAVNSAAAAGGMAGSPAAQDNAASVVNNLANQNYNNYLRNALGMYSQGLQAKEAQQGVDENMARMGEGASSSLADDIAGSLESQANLAYAGAQNKDQHQGGFMSGLGSMFGAGLGAASYFL